MASAEQPGFRQDRGGTRGYIDRPPLRPPASPLPLHSSIPREISTCGSQA